MIPTPLTALLGTVLAQAAPTAPLDPLAAPTDVSGYAFGADAVNFDPAAPAFADGLELQLRSRAEAGGVSLGNFGAYAVLPIFGLAPHAGYEWLNLPARKHQRLNLGVAARLNERLSIGLAYRRWLPRKQSLDDISQWDAGLTLQAASWVAVSVGVDAFNGPRASTVELKPALRLGAAVRPISGAPWLTVAADTRLITEPYDTRESRVLLDLGIEGLHAHVGYTPERGHVWFGASVSLLASELRAAVSPGWGDDTGQTGDTTMALTLRSEPQESVLHISDRTIEIPLTGQLESEAEGLLSTPPAIPTATLRLHALAENADVGTVILALGQLDVGLATVDELRDAVGALRQAGKRVVAELSNPNEKAYLVAAAADHVRLDPAGTITINGFAVTSYYLAEALAKIGVRFDSVEVGKYKTAPDTLTRSTPRPEQAEVQEELLAQAFARLVAALARDRELTPEQVHAVVERGAFTAEEALAAGLVDELSQPTDPLALPQTRMPGEPFAATLRPSRRWGKPPVIAVVPVVGTIVTQQGDNPLPGSSAVAVDIIAALEAAQRDDDVVGVVLRVDSGGGDVFAAELIWRAVRRLAETKPVVASMGEVAASGGYYVAAPAHAVLAEPSTVTGSIGIFSLRPDISGLLAMLGVNSVTYKAGEHADWDSITHPLRPEERERLRHILESYYGLFVSRVATGRGLSEERVREIGGGRVYTGQRALELGLVDATGGLIEAVAEAAARAGLDVEEEYDVAIPSRPVSLMSLLGGLVGLEGLVLQAWQDVLGRARAIEDRPLAVMPSILEATP